ncbi:hypothetical protein Cni_G09916 [Canna indica]|uniref:Disease resistance R13L4/SHOC-2-like LRR domain-containing protein n=1 Tax=Canna indica TaxID=4628 RepID=A0AAQ3K6K4_9LILI|nr:hypothetical protein Cni_G09916 [Canna indica]
MRVKKMTSAALVFLMLPLLISRGLPEPESSVAPMETAEREALYVVIQDLIGEWWNGSELYPDPCGWTQIQTTIPSSNWEKLAGSLENLEFRSNQGLFGEIPPNLGQLSNLQSLVLVENSLSGGLPGELGRLVHLKRLMLAGNRFSGRIPASLCDNLRELLILDVSRNSLAESLPSSIGSLSSLLKLDLSSNHLHGNLPRELGNLKQLTLLDLRNNNLSGGLPKSLPGMESLHDLLLAHNPWGGSLLEFGWESLRNLTTLDLCHAGLTGTIPEAIASLNSLRYLALDHNNLSGSVSSKFAALPSLSAFYLNGNNLTGKLEFPAELYRRMGRRFAAWGNPKLCYDSTGSIVLFGVAQCKQEQEAVTRNYDWNSNTKVDDANADEKSVLLASFWIPAASVSSIWWGIVVQEVAVMFLLVVFW